MATQVQNRRGTTAEHSTFTGANGELTVDTTKRTLVVHDGSTAGGRPLLREDQSNLPTSAPTTGIYNASGSLAISTNGTQRLLINDAGVLEYFGGPYRFYRYASGSANVIGRVAAGTQSSPTQSVGNVAALGLFGEGYDGAAYRICGSMQIITDGTISSTSAPGYITISTTPSGSVTPAERLRITSDGKLGLGTSSPAFGFVAAGTSFDGSWFNTSGNVSRMGLGGIASGSAGAFQIVFDRSTGVTNFGFGLRDTPSTAFTIDTSNRLGVGTTSPGYILDAAQSANADVAVNITNSSTGGGATGQFRASNGTSSAWFGIGGTAYNGYAQIRANGAAIYTASAAGIGLSADNANGYISFGTGSSAPERLRITSDGKVGLGTSSPTVLFEARQASAGASVIGASIRNDSSNASTGVILDLNPSGADAGVRSAQLEAVNDGVNQISLALKTASGGAPAATRIHITPDGKVGVGDTGPDSTLTVKAATGVTPFKVSGPSSEFARVDQSGRLLVGTSSDSGGALLQVNGDRIRVGTAKTPASATATGTAGEICWDASYVYVCTATNTWKRSALSTW